MNTLLRLTFACLTVAVLPLSHVRADEVGHTSEQPLVLSAARVFDGIAVNTDYSLLIKDGRIQEVGPSHQIRRPGIREIDLGDATILPGFIEMHGHVAFQNVPRDTLLRHGITTVRDVGGPLFPPSGGTGSLRVLTSGPIITAKGGYPLPIFGHRGPAGHSGTAAQAGHDNHSGHAEPDSHGGHGDHAPAHGGGHTQSIAAVVETPEQARETVRHLIHGGAAIIKVGLEPGGEAGAPWSSGHQPSVNPPWPLLSEATLKAVVDEAHVLHKQVTVHIGEAKGAELSLAAGVDEWAHVPCLDIPDVLLQRAVKQGVRIITTIDALSHCPGIHSNTVKLAKFGARFVYGAEVAHNDIPWGIDAEELHLMMRLAGMTAVEVLQSATSRAGEELGLAPLGTLVPGAPADLIAVKGNALEKFKLLEYPDLVLSGGHQIINYFPSGTGEH